MPDDYDYQERAAILEYDANLSRPDAEAVARGCCARPLRQAQGRQNHLVAELPPDSAGETGGAALVAPQPPDDPAADRRDPPDTAIRDDPGAGYPGRAPADLGGQRRADYAQAAARVSPAYLAARADLSEILQRKPKGATP